jgi:hypothetical protein
LNAKNKAKFIPLDRISVTRTFTYEKPAPAAFPLTNI